MKKCLFVEKRYNGICVYRRLSHPLTVPFSFKLTELGTMATFATICLLITVIFQNVALILDWKLWNKTTWHGKIRLYLVLHTCESQSFRRQVPCIYLVFSLISLATGFLHRRTVTDHVSGKRTIMGLVGLMHQLVRALTGETMQTYEGQSINDTDQIKQTITMRVSKINITAFLITL